MNTTERKSLKQAKEYCSELELTSKVTKIFLKIFLKCKYFIQHDLSYLKRQPG